VGELRPGRRLDDWNRIGLKKSNGKIGHSTGAVRS
jgi:hypothetical protein